MYATLATRVHTEVFHWSPAIRETRCVTFLVNRHKVCVCVGGGATVYLGVL